MAERYEVFRHPQSASHGKRQSFARKGLAFAYAKKHVGSDQNGAITIERQTEQQTSGGMSWGTTDTWTFYRDGNIEHSRN